MDKISAERRSANMRRIRSKNMSPELALHRFLHGLGYRFQLHRRDLPGQPDLVFPGRRKFTGAKSELLHPFDSADPAAMTNVDSDGNLQFAFMPGVSGHQNGHDNREGNRHALPAFT